MVFENGYATLEANLRTKSGEAIPFYFTGSLVHYNGKKCLVGTGVDLSNQEKSKETIRKSEEKYYALFQQASDPILVTDFTGNLLEANTSMCAMFGYSKEELIGLNISDLVQPGHLEKQPIQFAQLTAGLQVFSHYEMKRKNGTIIQIEANMKRSGDNMLMAILRDVTGRKLIEKNLALSEKNLRHVLSSSAENFYMISPKYEVLLINKAAERNLKTAWGKTITLGSNILEKIPANSNEPIKESFDKALGGEKVTYEYHIDVKGLPEWIEVNFIPVIDETNHITGVYVATKDITERKRTEAEKEAIRYKLNERVKELTTLYQFGQVLQEDGLSLKKLIRRLVVLLPPGWQYPQITAARIVLGSIDCRTKNYRNPAHQQIAEFHTSDGTAGMIEVAYLEKQKPEAEDAFFAEERYLINLLSEMLRNYLNRKKEAETLKKSEANLNTIFNTTDTIYILVDKKFRVISFNRPALNFVKKELGYELKTGGEWIKYFPADRKTALSTQLRKTLTGSFLNEESAFVQTDGSVNWYEQRAFPIAGEKDQVFGIMMAIMNITEKKLFEQHLLNQQVQEQKKIRRAMISAQEKERNHIGQELHDNINQILVGAKIHLTRAANKDKKTEDLINYPLQLIETSISEIRLLSSSQVTPQRNIDLKELVDSLLLPLKSSTKIKTVFRYSVKNDFISEDLKLNTYRIIQEQITNIIKHANAGKVAVLIESIQDSIHIRIADNGNGFDTKKKRNGIGISNMINRVESFNGNISINSHPGKGCTVEISIPNIE